MIAEQFLSIAGVPVILIGAWLCRRQPLFEVIMNAFAALFAAAIALRYWWLLASLIGSLLSFRPGEISFGSFWILFGLAYMLLLRLKNIPEDRDQPEFPGWAQGVFSFLFAAVTVCVIWCSLLSSLLIVLPKASETYDRDKQFIHWDRTLISVYQAAESRLLGIRAGSPEHTRFPKTDIPHDDTHEPLWE